MTDADELGIEPVRFVSRVVRVPASPGGLLPAETKVWTECQRCWHRAPERLLDSPEPAALIAHARTHEAGL